MIMSVSVWVCIYVAMICSLSIVFLGNKEK